MNYIFSFIHFNYKVRQVRLLSLKIPFAKAIAP
jgi:hypothetical protein